MRTQDTNNLPALRSIGSSSRGEPPCLEHDDVFDSDLEALFARARGYAAFARMKSNDEEGA